MSIPPTPTKLPFISSEGEGIPSSGAHADPKGLPLQGRPVVPVQSSPRVTTELTVHDGKCLRKLPDELLGIIVAAASDSLEVARPLLYVLTSGRSEDQAEHSPWTQRRVVRVMFQAHPRLQRESEREDLLRDFLRELGPSEHLSDVTETLERRARAKGHPEEEIRDWSTGCRTEGVLGAKVPRFIDEFIYFPYSKCFLIAYVDAGGDLEVMHVRYRGRMYWEVATSGPRSQPHTLREVPDRFRTPEFLRAAVAKHPQAYQYLKAGEASPEIWRAAFPKRDLKDQ